MTNKEMQREANAFAMELLMPAEWLRKEIANLKGVDVEDTAKVKRLADKFRVSVPVMILRIGQVMEL